MSRPRIFVCCLLLGSLAISATSFAKGPDGSRSRFAQPRSLDQAGFPGELYRQLIPPDNPQAPGKVALGEKLFFDKRLSEDNTVACASCHQPARGFADQRRVSEGIHHQFDRRNAPSLLNAAFNTLQFWDGREPTLEEQVRQPLVDPTEMGMDSIDEVVDRIGAIPEYRRRFNEVFGGPVTLRGLEMAIAAYERTLVSFDTPFDRFTAGDSKAIGEQAKRGWSLFRGKARCTSCHQWSPAQPLFTDGRFHNIGVSAHQSNFIPLARKALAAVAKRGVQQLHQLAVAADLSEMGRFLVTTQPHDIGAFRTPGLRNLLVTEPYFHDGSQATLRDVVEFYNKGGIRNSFLDRNIVPLRLSEAEIDDLVALLATLTSPEYATAARAEYERQASRTRRPLTRGEPSIGSRR